MKKATPLLGTLLVVSLAVNVIAIIRLSGERGRTAPSLSNGESPPSSPSVEAEKPAGGNGDTGLILAEIRRLRRDVASSRRPSAASAVPGGENAPSEEDQTGDGGDVFDLSPALAADSEVQTLLVERENRERFWEDLSILSDLREGLGKEKHRELALTATAGFLGMTPSTEAAFGNLSRSVLDEIVHARQERMSTNESVMASPTLSKEEKEAQRRENWRAFGEFKDAQLERLKTFLSGDPRQEKLSTSLEYWIHRVEPDASDWRSRRR